MLTERGWATMATGIALLVLWFLFGETELGLGALLLLGAAGGALVFISGRPPRIEVSRRISPAAVHEGDRASVNLRLTNRGRRVRQITLADEVTGLGTAEFTTADFPTGSEASAAYRVLCRPRGVYSIGPTAVTVSDPLGLASVGLEAGPTDTLVVYPAVENLTGLPGVPGRHLAVDARRPDHSQRGGEDFYTLREYQQGEDLRRVHWPSSARRDRLMIRQLETPWQARSLVFLDVRAGSYPDDRSFEAAVSGAASAARHLLDNTFETEVWTGGPVTPATGGASSYAMAMERLARVQPQIGVDLTVVANRLRSQAGGGMLVLVTGEPDEYLLGLARVLSGDYPTAVLLVSAGSETGFVPDFQRAGIVTVTPPPDQPWAPAWARAMRATWHAASVGS